MLCLFVFFFFLNWTSASAVPDRNVTYSCIIYKQLDSVDGSVLVKHSAFLLCEPSRSMMCSVKLTNTMLLFIEARLAFVLLL